MMNLITLATILFFLPTEARKPAIEPGVEISFEHVSKKIEGKKDEGFNFQQQRPTRQRLPSAKEPFSPKDLPKKSMNDLKEQTLDPYYFGLTLVFIGLPLLSLAYLKRKAPSQEGPAPEVIPFPQNESEDFKKVG